MRRKQSAIRWFALILVLALAISACDEREATIDTGPEVRLRVGDATYSESVYSYCWPQNDENVACDVDLAARAQPNQLVQVAPGAPVEFDIAADEPEPQALTVTLLDGAGGQTTLAATEGGAAYTAPSQSGQYRVQVDVQYADVSGSEAFVSYVFGLDVAGEAVAAAPSETPADAPEEAGTEEATEATTEEPAEEATEEPTIAPTDVPSETPTVEPTVAPTETPLPLPTPTSAPTLTPEEEETEEATDEPTAEATIEAAEESAAQVTRETEPATEAADREDDEGGEVEPTREAAAIAQATEEVTEEATEAASDESTDEPEPTETPTSRPSATARVTSEATVEETEKPVSATATEDEAGAEPTEAAEAIDEPTTEPTDAATEDATDESISTPTSVAGVEAEETAEPDETAVPEEPPEDSGSLGSVALIGNVRIVEERRTVPLADAEVTLTYESAEVPSSSQTLQTMTDENGQFAFDPIDLHEDDEIVLTFSEPGYATQEIELSGADAYSLPVINLILLPVTMPTPTPLPTATLTLTPVPIEPTATPTPEAPPTTYTGGAPILTLAYAGRAYEPLGYQLCQEGDRGALTDCIQEPTGTTARRRLSLMRGAAAQLLLAGDDRPLDVRIEYLTDTGVQTGQPEERIGDNIVLFTITPEPGNYILAVRVLWEDQQATYYFRVAVDG